jgi:hypothetical protein
MTAMQLTRSLRLGSAVLAACLGPINPALAQSIREHDHSMTTTASSDLRVGLNSLLKEHVYLAAATTGAALGGRQDEFKSAADALDANSVALSQAIGSVYGSDAGTAFLALWRKHIGFFVDYTTGVARKDKKAQDKAVQDLIGYASDFAAFLSSANPNLPASVVTDLVKAHVVGLKAAVDAQGKKDYATAYVKTREAAAHMQMIADPLASAIAKQFPDKFAMK